MHVTLRMFEVDARTNLPIEPHCLEVAFNATDLDDARACAERAVAAAGFRSRSVSFTAQDGTTMVAYVVKAPPAAPALPGWRWRPPAP